MLEGDAPVLPSYLLFPATCALALLLYLVVRRIDDLTAQYLVVAMWVRYVMSEFHQFTYPPIAGSLSLNALGSMVIFGIGCLVVPRHLFALRRLAPFYALMAVIVVSGLMNGQIGTLVSTSVKWGIYLIVALCVFDVMQRHGPDRTLNWILWAFSPLVTYQWLSVVFRIQKATDEDQVSYIGGYFHEAAFSTVLLSCLCVAVLALRYQPKLRNGIIVVCIVGILLANYRTTILAMAPVVVGYFTVYALTLFPPRQRVAIAGVVVAIVCLAGFVAVDALAQRFMDIVTVLSKGPELFKPPGYYTDAEHKLLSARVYFWSQYLDAYRYGTDMRLLFGFGPDARDPSFERYAHNELIAYIYEYGAIGATMLVWLWISMLVMALRVPDGRTRFLLASAHASFMVQNMATMPLWMVEGMILYGILCGYTFFLTVKRPAPAAELPAPVVAPTLRRPQLAPSRRAEASRVH